MKNNNVKKLQITADSLPIGRFNLSRDVHTTFGFGEFQPTLCKEMLPNSSLTETVDTGVLLAPMVGPTMGRLTLDTFGMFVPTRDVLPFYDAYITGTRFSYAGNTFVPLHRPQLPLFYLSLFVLYGARATFYRRRSTGNNGSLEVWETMTSANTDTHLQAIATTYGGNSEWIGLHDFSAFGGERCASINAKMLVGNSLPVDKSFYIPLFSTSTQSTSQALAMDGKAIGDSGSSEDDVAYVDIDAADYVIQVPYTLNGVEVVGAFAFKLSSFGKRIRKVLLGLGYKIDFTTASSYDITPLLATYKAYFDMFGLLQWSNIEDTNMKKCINRFMLEQCPSNCQFSETQRFILDLGRLWFTDEQDYVSAHQANIENDSTISPASGGVYFNVGSTLGSVGTTSEVVSVVNGTLSESDFNTNMHAAINRVLHSQMDSDFLKKLSLWTNRNSVLGQSARELLKAQGHETWIDEHKSNFIGRLSVPLQLKNVVSEADTWDSSSEQGSMLGEYGGRGIGYAEYDRLSFKTSELGYFIALSCVVPKSGYVQGLDASLRRLDRFDEYQPMFDAFGMEPSPKNVVCAETDFSSILAEDGSLTETFGFIPRDTRFKVLPNINNGDFNLMSRRNYYLPWTLDKIIRLNSRDFYNESRLDDAHQFYASRDDATPANLPTAGNTWRYLTRYGWLGNLSRIFSQRGNDDFNPGDYGNVPLFDYFGDPMRAEIFPFSDDNFVAHFVQSNTYYAHMLPIEKSFGTLDGEAGVEGKTNMVASKA